MQPYYSLLRRQERPSFGMEEKEVFGARLNVQTSDQITTSFDQIPGDRARQNITIAAQL